jgi:hypothetical protein
VESFDFDAGKGQEIADLLERAGSKVEPFLEPVEGNVHQVGRRKWDEVIFNGKSVKSTNKSTSLVSDAPPRGR